MENTVYHSNCCFSLFFLFPLFLSCLCFLLVSKENNKSHMESTFLVNSSDILVICSESARRRLITFVPRVMLVCLPDVYSNTGMLEFIIEVKLWEQNLEVLIVGQKSKTGVGKCLKVE